MASYDDLNELSIEQLIESFNGKPLDGAEFAYSYYSEVALSLRKQGTQGIKFLLDEANKADPLRLSAILFALSTLNKNAKVQRLLISNINNSDFGVISNAIDGLRHQEVENLSPRILSFTNHPSPYVRGAALRYLAYASPNAAQPLLIAALTDPHFLVRENAIDEISDLELVDLIPLIKKSLSDEHPHVRQAAQTAIDNLHSKNSL